MSVRFAPSPTGRFHVGNLRTAWISHFFSKKLEIDWVVRFEDIDTPRVVPDAAETQLQDLKRLGMVPDRVVIQSKNTERHETLFRMAVESGAVYPCFCSRKEILQGLQSIASAPHEEAPIYDGRCRNEKTREESRSDHPTIAWRFLNPKDPRGCLDFIVARTDRSEKNFLPSYHWACAIDDYDGEHSLLVRAWDLAHVIPLQSLIFYWVGEALNQRKTYPAVFHTSLVTQNDGHRLEKRTQGVTLPELLENGVTEEKLIERFLKSFDENLVSHYSLGKIWGEARKELPLKSL